MILTISMVLSVFAFLIPSEQVRAQGTTTLEISPSVSTTGIGQEITLTVTIEDVTNLYGYDVNLSFDPAIIQVLAVANGTFLAAGSQFQSIDNVSGTVMLYNTQLNPATPKSGSGDLLTIRIVGIAEGTSPIGFVWNDLSDRNGFLIPVSGTSGGSVLVGPGPTAANQLSFSSKNDGLSAMLNWETANESDNLGFNLYRSASSNGPKTRVNASLIPTKVPPGSLLGAAYSYADTGSDLSTGLKPGQTYFYWLESVSISGKTDQYGPVTLTIPGNGVTGDSSSITAYMGSTSFTGTSAGKPYSSSDLARKQFKFTPLVNWRQHHRIHSGAFYEFLRSQGSSPNKVYSFWLDGVHLLSQDFVFSSMITRAKTK